MKIDQVISQFMLAPIMAQTPTTLHTLKQSAVLIPIVDVNTRAHLLFCKRSSELPSHPSQICFPGGKVEQQDSNIINTALRETEEEIGLTIAESQVLAYYRLCKRSLATKSHPLLLLYNKMRLG